MRWQKSSRESQRKINEIKLYEYGNQIDMEFVVLSREHKEIAQRFKCNNEYIDKFVKKIAWKDKGTVTYAVIDNEENRIVTIMTLVASGIYTVHSNNSRRPNIVLPAVEIKNFATDIRYQKIPMTEEEGTTLSKMIFSKYLRDILELSKNTIGINKIVLYSVDQALNFYKCFGFKDFKSYMARSEDYAIKGCTPMYMNVI
ncbi:MAG: hypothetical protein J6L65_06890 [Lachnospiraceae bacterium]|nr:hypothetical protein [Lachnospiraceae bacterium]